MTTYIVQGENVISPQVVDGYQATSASANRVHRVLGISNPDVTLRPAGLRTGTLRLIFGGVGEGDFGYAVVDGYIVEVEAPEGGSETLAREAETLHRDGGVFSLNSDERGSVVMSYVVSDGGSIVRELDDTTRDVWIVSIDFQEVEL